VGLSADAFKYAFGDVADSAKAGAEAVTKGMADARSSFLKEFDVVSQFSATAWSKMQADTERGTGAIGDEIAAFYTKSLEQGKSFTDGITTAIEKGYDPQVVAELLAEGPREAAPVIAAIVADNDGTLRNIVNEGQKMLSEQSALAVKIARLTHIAINAENDAVAGDLSTAMGITERIMADGGQSSVAALSRELHVGEGEVRRVMAEYGIAVGGVAPTFDLVTQKSHELGTAIVNLPAAVLRGDGSQALAEIARLKAELASLDGRVVTTYERVVQQQVREAARGQSNASGYPAATGGQVEMAGVSRMAIGDVVAARGMAFAGPVPGQGPGDHVPILAEPGEFMIRKTSAQKIGLPALRQLNAMAAGGPVGMSVGHGGGWGGGNVTVNVVVQGSVTAARRLAAEIEEHLARAKKSKGRLAFES
jgi:hypothetical protein